LLGVVDFVVLDSNSNQSFNTLNYARVIRITFNLFQMVINFRRADFGLEALLLSFACLKGYLHLQDEFI